jgi:hypothetical protein
MASKLKGAIFDMDDHGVRATSAKRLILLCMSENGSPEGFCWYSKHSIGRMAGLDPDTVQKHVAELQGAGRIRIWEWRNSNGRQGANMYKIELPGLSPVGEITVSWLRANRGGEPVCGWERFRQDLGLPAVAPKPVKSTPPQDAARDPETEAPQVESEGPHFGELRDLGLPVRGTSDPPAHKDDNIKPSNNPEIKSSPLTPQTGDDGLSPATSKPETPGDGTGVCPQISQITQSAQTGTPEIRDGLCELLAVKLYGVTWTQQRDARQWMNFLKLVTGRINDGRLPRDRVLGMASEIHQMALQRAATPQRIKSPGAYFRQCLLDAGFLTDGDRGVGE